MAKVGHLCADGEEACDAENGNIDSIVTLVADKVWYVARSGVLCDVMCIIWYACMCQVWLVFYDVV